MFSLQNLGEIQSIIINFKKQKINQSDENLISVFGSFSS